ncbi:hypothetical protein OJ996_11920 [Luteolibacter sp. GHJ8]|uniref:Uncharacterized protein n=1 Tax=Luteolibacter rhizosphaerae TaxID=2989719 RepID=A0ABT3G359_9BACT|nr:hypothetical protein [Luteolibacter rhizosphaerae]MCW1914287.1 hypothetical protein [Luteolibacter rhizosphaerae]
MKIWRSRWVIVLAALICLLLILADRKNAAYAKRSAYGNQPTGVAESQLKQSEEARKSNRVNRAAQLKLSPEQQKLISMGVFSDENAASFFLIGVGDKIPSDALREVGLTEDNRPELEAIVDRLTDTMGSLISDQAVQDEAEAAKGNVVYHIPADPQGGANALLEFRQQLTTSFGPTIADALMRGLHCPQFFGAFGKQDVRLQVTDGISHSGTPVYYVDYSCSDPSTGKKYREGRETHESFQSRFGHKVVDKIFEAKARMNQE